MINEKKEEFKITYYAEKLNDYFVHETLVFFNDSLRVFPQN